MYNVTLFNLPVIHIIFDYKYSLTCDLDERLYRQNTTLSWKI